MKHTGFAQHKCKHKFINKISNKRTHSRCLCVSITFWAPPAFFHSSATLSLDTGARWWHRWR